MKIRLTIMTVLGLLTIGRAWPDDAPERCRAPVLIPETFETFTEQVLDQDERTEIRYFPAEYETVQEKVQVREAATEYRIVAAVYEAVTEQVLVRPERTETHIIPAEYETYTEQVLVRQAYTTWKLRDEVVGRSVAEHGAAENMLTPLDVPAEYKTVTRTRVITPEQSETRIVPAEYRTLVKQVLVVPARVEPIEVPAEDETIYVERLLSPAREEIVVIPATYRTVEKRIVTGGGTAEWRDVLCDAALTRKAIKGVQNALNEAGFAVEEDGMFGPATRTALEGFQRERGLGVGQLTYETLQALGVTIR
jgi:Putative peptidoglycan binding domain